MKKTQRILAIIGIVLLLSMYVVCFILAIVGKHQATTLFRAALGATIAVPIVLYAFMMLLKVFPMFKKNEEFGSGADGAPEDGGEAFEDAGEAVEDVPENCEEDA